MRGVFMRLYDPERIPRSIIPENQEFPMLTLSSQLTPENLYYIRNHFPYPAIPMHNWYLQIQGLVHKTLQLHYQDLMKMPQVTLPVTMECSGNKRGFFHPKAPGEQWELGAVSHALWTGVPLRDILQHAGILSHAQEVVFEGMDSGQRTDMPGTFFYARSLPIDKAMHPDTLVALFMNGKPLPYKHGYPLRLIVPGWYGMASVKWLRSIVIIDRPFHGPFQTVDYVIYSSDSDTSPRPVTTMKVNSVIAQPTDQAILIRGTHQVIGTAWSGDGPVVQIEVSLDNGNTWHTATWLDPVELYSWRRWSWTWHALRTGTYHLMVKATDAGGHTQPMQAEWNVKGYENNSVHHIQVYVE
jgi:DMSO/TMAO reductase YedYZ molybdopterin-dependent catalytic subunit